MKGHFSEKPTRPQKHRWVGMAISYSQDSSSFSEALAKTFDGKHPCKLCKFVAEESRIRLLSVVTLSSLLTAAAPTFAQGTVFTYQGRLNDGGSPANGTNYGMVFYL